MYYSLYSHQILEDFLIQMYAEKYLMWFLKRNIETIIILKLIIQRKKCLLASVPLSNHIIKINLFSTASQDLAEEDFELPTEEEREKNPEQIAYR